MSECREYYEQQRRIEMSDVLSCNCDVKPCDRLAYQRWTISYDNLLSICPKEIDSFVRVHESTYDWKIIARICSEFDYDNACPSTIEKFVSDSSVIVDMIDSNRVHCCIVVTQMIERWNAICAAFAKHTGLQLEIMEYNENRGSIFDLTYAHEGVLFLVEGVEKFTEAGEKWKGKLFGSSFVQ